MAAHIQLRWFQFKFLNEPSPHLKLSRPGEFETIKLESYMGEANSAAVREGNHSQHHSHPLHQKCSIKHKTVLIMDSWSNGHFIQPTTPHHTTPHQIGKSIQERDNNLGFQPQAAKGFLFL